MEWFVHVTTRNEKLTCAAGTCEGKEDHRGAKSSDVFSRNIP